MGGPDESVVEPLDHSRQQPSSLIPCALAADEEEQLVLSAQGAVRKVYEHVRRRGVETSDTQYFAQETPGAGAVQTVAVPVHQE